MKLFKFISRICLFISVILFAGEKISFSQIPEYEASQLFQSDELLSLTITMDMRRVLKDIEDEREEHTAIISYVSPAGDTVEFTLQIRTRGHFRRDPLNCNFPPLRLNFAEDSTYKGIFSGHDKLKLVTHCMSRGKQHEQNLLKEYLAYRLYNLFTDESYRVRLAEITYADLKGRRDTLHKMGFLLEPTDHMARRNNCVHVGRKNVQQEQCEPLKTARLAVFQYMIGNTDWSVPAPHNISLIQVRPGTVPVAVPYDFDWCGLVDAPYAVPAENLGIDDVKVRFFRGFCRSEQEFDLIFREFHKNKEEVFLTIESIPHLDEKEKNRARRYIEEFYSTLDSPLAVRNEFINNCRTDNFR